MEAEPAEEETAEDDAPPKEPVAVSPLLKTAEVGVMNARRTEQRMKRRGKNIFSSGCMLSGNGMSENGMCGEESLSVCRVNNKFVWVF